MRPAKSISSMTSNRPTKKHNDGSFNPNDENAQARNQSATNNQPITSPICRCRVMYLGSSVPHITKDGLQGIQEPLKELYPDKSALDSGNAGIDSWLSVWSNGILIENVDETGKETKRFFKIDALHYCAAVKYVPLPISTNFNPYTTLPNGNALNAVPKFLPLDSPQARQPNPNPPMFASILRRTTGIKVLECHAFICKREAAANALVRCCFHAYADTMYAKQIGAELSSNPNSGNSHRKNASQDSPGSDDLRSQPSSNDHSYQLSSITQRRAKSIATLNESEPNEAWDENGNNLGSKPNSKRSFEPYQDQDSMSSMTRRKSINGSCAQGETSRQSQNPDDDINNNLRLQQRFSKSLHHLNGQDEQIRQKESWLIQQVNQQSFYNPYASRVPSYPPSNLLDSQAASNGGTLRSIKSMAANSIASTLLRSKKHAKAMSMAQLNQEKLSQTHSTMLPPIPPMFMTNMPRVIMNGSQTMRPMGSGPMIPLVPPPSFDTLTPKEVKKMLKKNAKYGLDPHKLMENGLPPVFHPPLPISLGQALGPQSKSGTMMTTQSMFADMYGNPMQPMLSDINQPGSMNSIKGRMPFPPPPDQLKPIPLKPTSEFLKSKVGKKWLKQQKQFKKFLPPHLDGLPIVFGPPPLEGLEAANIPTTNGPMTPYLSPHLGLPMMDSHGYFTSNSYGIQPNGRASAASTLLRYSPHSQMAADPSYHDFTHESDVYIGMHQQPLIYGHPAPMMHNGLRDNLMDNSSLINLEMNHSKQFINQPMSNGNQRRHQMVEQSVISLGDENDYEDDVQSETGHYHDHSNQVGSNYDVIQGQTSRQQPPQPPKHRAVSRNGQRINGNENGYHIRDMDEYQQNYSNIGNQASDDQSSYSSGIYKREHIGERAFSYSIRQEQKSNGQSDYGRVENNYEDPRQPSRHQKKQLESYHHDQQQALNINELSSRLENQLNMKSFANAKMKSHI